MNTLKYPHGFPVLVYVPIKCKNCLLPPSDYRVSDVSLKLRVHLRAAKKQHLAMAELPSSVLFNTTPSASTGPTFKVRAIPGNWTPSITGRDFLRYSETIQKF
jgi:hypothetical protein